MGALCKVCQVSRSGFYDWKNRQCAVPERLSSERKLTVKIGEIFSKSQQTYGVIRVTRKLKKEGLLVNKKRVARIMRLNDFKAIHRTKFKPCTTDSQHDLKIAPNIVKQDFTATAVNQKWGCDITYIKTQQGWLYLAIVLDFYSRKIIGWAFDDSLHAELACNALKMALICRRPPKCLIHHSDRGVQYASLEYTRLIRKQNFIQSMSRKANCYDNAMVESCFHSIKTERINRRNYLNAKHAINDVTDYIINWYNSERLHSSLDYCSPNEYEDLNRLVA